MLHPSLRMSSPTSPPGLNFIGTDRPAVTSFTADAGSIGAINRQKAPFLAERITRVDTPCRCPPRGVR